MCTHNMSRMVQLLPDFPQRLYSELLDSNEIPSPTQISGIHSLINQVEKDVVRLRSADSFLEFNVSSLRELRDEGDRRETFLEQYRVLLHTVSMRQLPYEIWVEIFRLCIGSAFYEDEEEVPVDSVDCPMCRCPSFPVDPETSLVLPSFPDSFLALHSGTDFLDNSISFPIPEFAFVQPHHPEPFAASDLTRGLPLPFILSQVCHHWRKILLATPELWSLVRFFLPSPPNQVQTWLARSAKRPLTVRVRVDNLIITRRREAPVGWTAVNDPGLRALVKQSRRLVDFDVNMKGVWGFRDVLHQIGRSAPLQRLHTRNSLVDAGLGGLPLLRHTDLPDLTELSWYSKSLSDISRIPSYRNLIRLSGTFSEVNSLSEIFETIFESMPKLSVLDLAVKFSVERLPEDNLPHVVHDSLTSLTIVWTANHQWYPNQPVPPRTFVDRFLQHVTFPSLVNFAVTVGLGPGKPEVLSSFFIRHPALNTVHLVLPKCEMQLARSSQEAFGSVKILNELEDGSRVPTEVDLPPGNNWKVLKWKIGH